MLTMCGETGGVQPVEVITQVQAVQRGEERGGICVYFPGEAETMWDVARRYRVDEASLARLNAQRAAGEPIVVMRRRHG